MARCTNSKTHWRWTNCQLRDTVLLSRSIRWRHAVRRRKSVFGRWKEMEKDETHSRSHVSCSVSIFWESIGEIIFLRVCAINSCGRSQFSEYGSYKTSTPGFPGAPWNIKVSKTDLGASLAWQPPANADVIEYSVYLSVKKEYTTGQSVSL